MKPEAHVPSPSPRVWTCPHCGPDANGGEIHRLTHHASPRLTPEQAKAHLAAEAKAANQTDQPAS